MIINNTIEIVSIILSYSRSMCYEVLAIQNLRGFMALLEDEERQICVRVANIN